jgi:hypothetical protein
VVAPADPLGACRNDGPFIVKKFGQVLRRAAETGAPNLRSSEPVARMPSAGITNLPQASAFSPLTCFKPRGSRLRIDDNHIRTSIRF